MLAAPSAQRRYPRHMPSGQACADEKSFSAKWIQRVLHLLVRRYLSFDIIIYNDECVEFLGSSLGHCSRWIIPLLRGNSTWIHLDRAARFHGSRLLLRMGMARSRVSVEEASPTAVVIPRASYDRHSHISTWAMVPFFLLRAQWWNGIMALHPGPLNLTFFDWPQGLLDGQFQNLTTCNSYVVLCPSCCLWRWLHVRLYEPYIRSYCSSSHQNQWCHEDTFRKQTFLESNLLLAVLSLVLPGGFVSLTPQSKGWKFHENARLSRSILLPVYVNWLWICRVQ